MVAVALVVLLLLRSLWQLQGHLRQLRKGCRQQQWLACAAWPAKVGSKGGVVGLLIVPPLSALFDVMHICSKHHG
jgi:hypothetical protein